MKCSSENRCFLENRRFTRLKPSWNSLAGPSALMRLRIDAFVMWRVDLCSWLIFISVSVIRLGSAEDIESVKSPFTVKMLENIPSIPHPKALEERFPDAAPEALDLMRKLLHFNPNKRLTVEVCAIFNNSTIFCSPPLPLRSNFACSCAILVSFCQSSNHCGTRMLLNFTTRRMSLCARRSSRSKSMTMSSASACIRSHSCHTTCRFDQYCRLVTRAHLHAYFHGCAGILFPTIAPCFMRKSSRKRRSCAVNKRPSCWPRNSNRLLWLPPRGILKCLRTTTTMMMMIKSNRPICAQPLLSAVAFVSVNLHFDFCCFTTELVDPR